MALIKCSNCGHMVSDKGTKCPKCGTPIIKVDTIPSKEKEDKKVSEVESPQNSILQEESTPVKTTVSTDNSEKPRRSKKGIIVGICILLVISAIVGGGWYLWDKELHPQKMYKELHEAAENGDIDAQYKLGIYYWHGNKSLKQDYDEAVKWLLKAAEQEHEDAIYDLGFCYYDMEKYDEAVKWFRKSADFGEPRAQYFLGLCYEKGYGIDPNGEEAFYWYQKAAEQGDKEAMQWLAENVAVATADTVSVGMSDEYFMTKAYDLTLYSVESEYGEYASCEYFLYDITMDGLPELWIKVGTCEADYMLLVYTCDNDLKKLYEDRAGHSYFCTGRDYVLQVYGHMGEAAWMKLTYKNGEIDVETIFEEEINFDKDEWYTEPKERKVQLYPSHDKQPIYNMFTAE